MKMESEIIIDASQDVVWKAFHNPNNMMKWQPTLKSVSHTSGEPGQPGAIAELVYDENGREIVMTERITERRDPDFLAGSYETDFGTTVIVNHFEIVSDSQTRWKSYSRHSFTGIMRFLAIFMRRSICKRLDDDMQRFKLMVESQVLR